VSVDEQHTSPDESGASTPAPTAGAGRPTAQTAQPGRAVRAVVLDVNGTLTDMSPLGERLAEVGLAASDLRAWFAQTLRDGFAVAVAGRNADFAEVAGSVLATMLAAAGDRPADDRPAGDRPADTDRGEAVQYVLDGFRTLPLHPDVEPGLRALADAGIRVAALTNGSAGVTTAMLANAGVEQLVERVLSVADAPAWKPAPPAYRYGLRELGLPASSVVLAAAHPWDVDGATRSGLRGALIARNRSVYPPYFARPEFTVSGLDALAQQLPAPR